MAAKISTKVALYGLEAPTVKMLKALATYVGFEVVAICATGGDYEKARQLADELGVSLYTNLEGMFKMEEISLLIVARPLEEAKRAATYALDRGAGVHCEVASADLTLTTRFALYGRAGSAMALAAKTVVDSGFKLVGIGSSDFSEIEGLARQVRAVPYATLTELLRGGGFGALCISLPWEEAQPVMDEAAAHGVCVVVDALPEPETSMAAVMGAADEAPGFAFRDGAEPNGKAALLVGPEDPDSLIRRLSLRIARNSVSDLVAVIAPDRERAETIGRALGVEWAGSISEAREKTYIDRVVLPGSPRQHRPVVIEALERELNVVCSMTPRGLPLSVLVGQRPFGYAVLGCGNAVTGVVWMLRVLLDRIGAAIVAVADHDDRLARRDGGDLGVPVLSSEEMVDSSEVHGVLLLGPPTEYEEEIMRLLEAGLPVFPIKGLGLLRRS